MGRIGHVDDPRVAPTRAVAQRHAVRLDLLGAGNAGVDERPAQVVAVAHLQLMEAARAAAGVEHRQQPRRGRASDVPQAQPALAGGRRVGAEHVADLQPDRGDVAAGERAVPGGVDHDVLVRGARHLQVRDHRRPRRVARVDDGDAAAWAELRVRGVEEAPAPDVGEPLVGEDVAVEAARAEVVLADGGHVQRRPALGPAAVGLAGRIQEVLLVGE